MITETVKALKFGKRTVKIMKPGVAQALNVVKQFGKICLGAGALYCTTECIRNKNKSSYTEMTEDAQQVRNRVQNAKENLVWEILEEKEKKRK